MDYLFLPCWFFIFSCVYSFRWLCMSGAIVAVIHWHFLHSFIHCHLPLKPWLFAIQSTLSCASAWACSVPGFEQPAVSSASNVPNSVTRKQTNKQMKIAEKSQHFTLFMKPEFSNVVPQEKIFCSNLETNIQSVQCICFWPLLGVTPQAEEVFMCEWMTVLHSSPNVSKGNFFD